MKLSEKTRRRLLLLSVILLGSILGAAGGVYVALTHDLPQIRSLGTYKPSAVSRIYSDDNVMLRELYSERREPVPFNQIPDAIKTAIITTEDRAFYSHSGVDLKGILRALVKDIKARKFVEGASTITQQLSKTLFLTHKKTLSRKLKEMILAFQLERRYTKDEILTLYLNQVYFGSGAYGIKSAARLFFDKSPQALSLAECALIAGMPKSPSRYSPLLNPELAVKRRNIVLKQMFATGAVSRTAYKKAINEPLSLTARSGRKTLAPYFVDFVVRELENQIGTSHLYRGGLTIHTTLDYRLQQAAEAACIRQMALLDERMQSKGIEKSAPQCAVVGLDVATGCIRSMIGGASYDESSYNRATNARRQPGSAFKPILYAYAIEQGMAQNLLIQDTPIRYPGPGNAPPWQPENFSKTYSGEMTLRYALTHSKNVPAVRLIEMLGVAPVVQFAHTLGIESPLSPYLSLALGTSELTLLELTAAYNVFPNKGNYNTPIAVSEIEDADGRIIWRARHRRRAAMSRQGAAIITDMLSGVIKEGTGRKAGRLPGPLAGKTGTTNDYKDALFIGFSPALTVGVWVGTDDWQTLGKGETGARAALPIWMDIMRTAQQSKALRYFDIPEETVKARIDPLSGRILPENASDGVEVLLQKSR